MPLIRPRPLVPALAFLALACGQDIQSPRETDQRPALATAASGPLAFRQLSAGLHHTCGVTTDKRAFCWGRNNAGQLGDNTTVDSYRPAAVLGGLSFLMVSAGAEYTCGLTTASVAYCWGENAAGQLGDGSTTARSTPVLVAGGRRFRQVRAGYFHTCAINPSDVAFCWGSNGNGQLGDGTTTNRLVPARVKTDARFRWVFAAGLHSCGATTDFRALCWGRNEDGQLGNGTTVRKVLPTPVAGSRAFRVATVGAFRGNGKAWNARSCGITTGDQAYCWGDNVGGSLGNGTTGNRSSPQAVTGGLHFTTLSVGAGHVCGLDLDARAWCWGTNGNGELGIGSMGGGNGISAPIAVNGGLQFKGITAGTLYTCGIATDDRAYCWGGNQYGQVGDGTANSGALITPHTQPAPVLGPT